MLQTYVRIDKTGQVISNGANEKIAVKQFKHTACVNDGDELSIGSVCANAVEIAIFDMDGKLDLTAGDEIWVARGEEGVEIGRFIIEQPTRPTANTMKVTGYDLVTKLDKDLTGWLNSLTEWPYSVETFAPMVAAQCGLRFAANWETTPNAGYLIQKFSYTGVTGRMLMRWLGEICARFCYADGDVLRFGWYKSSGVTIQPVGDRYYFEGGLTYEAYETAPIEAVQLQLADSDSGVLWPEKAEGVNSYVIRNNAILQSNLNQATEHALDTIARALKTDKYTPCKVAIPACLDITTGDTVNIVDKNGKPITAYVMTKVTEGQKDTIECTGSARRDSTKNLNNQKPASQNDAVNVAKSAVQKAQEIFGEKQGLYYQDGKWYINLEVVQVLNLVAEMINAGTLYGMLIKAGKIQSEDGKISIDLSQGDEPVFNGGISTNSLTVRSDVADSDNIFSVFSEKITETLSTVRMVMRMVDGTEIFNVTEYLSGNTDVLNGILLKLMSPVGSGSFEVLSGENQTRIQVFGDGASVGSGVNIYSYSSAGDEAISCGIDLADWDAHTSGYFRLKKDGYAHLQTSYLNGMRVNWESNGDGTYSLVGR